ncbi:helix-turn-helix transcriptional regulator [Micromonospora aurantiaca (nom. illeg.)]|uniref:helix-turn-helix transcriptional regulator n=1 Tax=Micromonospora aurantiaca (nom. illeg.) TaxID=47850 RepID=UPI0034431B19
MELELFGAAEIQERLGVSRQRAYIIISRKGFPEPVATLKMGSVWMKADIEAWIAENRPHLLESDEEV